MRDTRRKHIALVVLGVALAAFAADRWLSGDEQSQGAVAQANAASPTKTPLSATLTLDKAPKMPTRPESLLACRLEELTHGQGGEGRDIFRPSVQWIAPKPTPAAKAEADVVEADPVSVFQSRHKLSAVLVNGGGGAAVISNTLMRVGQSLDGFRLNEIRRNAVTFTAPDGRTIVLSIDGANLDS